MVASIGAETREPSTKWMPPWSLSAVTPAAGCNLSETETFLAQLPGLQEIHHMIGEWCFLLKVRTTNPQTLEHLVYQQLRNHPHVRRTLTTLATSSPFETTALPLSDALEAVQAARRN